MKRVREGIEGWIDGKGGMEGGCMDGFIGGGMDR